ncbi:MAG: hypothetical protein J6C96_03845 [Oscillospiraceae bacterium]|nr:hypothetical protein [Oscillospiraceae bacterium]
MSDEDVKIGTIKVSEDEDGKALWEFEGKVGSDIPLLTEAQNFAEAINELFQLGSGGGDIRAIIDDDAGSITIVIGSETEKESGTETAETAETVREEEYTDCLYTYDLEIYSDEITMKSASGTHTKKFEKRIVTAVYDSTGNQIMAADYNADTGNVAGYTDEHNLPIHTKEWRSESGTGNDGMPGADAATVAWCIARTMEQAAAFELAKKMYRDGVIDGKKAGAEIDEPWETTDTTIELNPDEDGISTDYVVTDLTDGVWLTYENPNDPTDVRHVKFWITHDLDGMRYVDGTGVPVAQVYDGEGNQIGPTPSEYPTMNVLKFLSYSGNIVGSVYNNGSINWCITEYQITAGWGVRAKIIDWNGNERWTGSDGTFTNSIVWDQYVNGYVYVSAGNAKVEY